MGANKNTTSSHLPPTAVLVITPAFFSQSYFRLWTATSFGTEHIFRIAGRKMEKYHARLLGNCKWTVVCEILFVVWDQHREGTGITIGTEERVGTNCGNGRLRDSKTFPLISSISCSNIKISTSYTLMMYPDSKHTRAFQHITQQSITNSFLYTA